MFDVGQILCVGGAQDYGFSDAFNNAYVLQLGDPGDQVQVHPTGAMDFRRVFANAAALPDGTVLITGGQTYSEPFTNNNATLNAELCDPKTGAWTTLAAEINARTYHSISILLPDATVMTAGGGLCWDAGTCDPAADHPDGQIITPLYLLKGGQRPVIADMAFPDNGPNSYSVPMGGKFSATLQGAPAGDVTFSTVRLESATHSVNTDQRRIPLVPTGGGNGASYDFQLDPRPGVVSPGYWYFFAKVNGVPSVSRTIQIQ
jgi:galactose oxidase